MLNGQFSRGIETTNGAKSVQPVTSVCSARVLYQAVSLRHWSLLVIKTSSQETILYNPKHFLLLTKQYLVISMCVTHGLASGPCVHIDCCFKLLINRQLCRDEVFLTALPSSKLNYFTVASRAGPILLIAPLRVF